MIKRTEENGGDIIFKTYQELEQAFADKVNILDDFLPTYNFYYFFDIKFFVLPYCFIFCRPLLKVHWFIKSNFYYFIVEITSRRFQKWRQ